MKNKNIGYWKGKKRPDLSKKYKKEGNPNFKREKLSYEGIHYRIRQIKPKPKFCDECGKEKRLKLYDILKKDSLNPNDYKWLCLSCLAKKYRGKEWYKKVFKIRKDKGYKKYPIELYPNHGFRKNRKDVIIPKKDSKPEKKIQEILKELNIEFKKHKYIPIKYSYQCDIFIPSKNLIIECDGDYWHGNPDKFDYMKLSNRIRSQRILDFERTNQMEEKGYKVIRLWEFEIKNINMEEFERRINKEESGKLLFTL